jgi:carboxyl-terminal processing protease
MKYKLVRIVLKEKRDRWHGLAKDIYVEEALNVLDDLQTKLF